MSSYIFLLKLLQVSLATEAFRPAEADFVCRARQGPWEQPLLGLLTAPDAQRTRL